MKEESRRVVDWEKTDRWGSTEGNTRWTKKERSSILIVLPTVFFSAVTQRNIPPSVLV